MSYLDEHAYPYYKNAYKKLSKQEFNKLVKKSMMINRIRTSIPIKFKTVNNRIEKYTGSQLKNKGDGYLFIEDKWSDGYILNMHTDLFTEECRVKCTFADFLSPFEYWTRNKLKLLKQTTDIEELRDIIYLNSRLCSNFRITLALTILKLFKVKRWLDISAGWGDRLISAIGHGVERYVACDPNKCLYPGYRRIINTLSPITTAHSDPAASSSIDIDTPIYTILNTGFEISNLPNEKFDTVFSGPPYFDLEKYSDETDNSFTKYKNSTNWYTKFLIPAIDKAVSHLDINGHLILYMDEGMRTGYISKMRTYLDARLTSLGIIYYYDPNSKPRPLYVWQNTPKIDTTSMINLNPPIIITPITINDGRTFHVIRDDYLIGGTKQRMISGVIDANPLTTEFVYAGPVEGYAQIALSYGCSIYGKKATLLLPMRRPLHSLTKFAKKYNPKIIEIERATRKELIARAERYVENVKKKCGNDYIILLPSGFYQPDYIKILANQIKKAYTGPIPKRMWLVAGSATLLNSLYIVFPKTHFLVVQVGMTIWPDQIQPNRTTLYISKERFSNIAKKQPPYPSVNTYDAKAWIFILQDGKSGDYIWNVGKTK
jgi:hypothetical protein